MDAKNHVPTEYPNFRTFEQVTKPQFMGLATFPQAFTQA